MYDALTTEHSKSITELENLKVRLVDSENQNIRLVSDLDLSMKHIEDLENDSDMKSKVIDQGRRDLETLNAKITSYEAELGQKRKELETLTIKNEDSQLQIQTHISEKSELSQQIIEHEQKLNSLMEENKRLILTKEGSFYFFIYFRC
jgi:chromosome segregation ATPase